MCVLSILGYNVDASVGTVYAKMLSLSKMNDEVLV
jgi:hypothetical protein